MYFASVPLLLASFIFLPWPAVAQAPDRKRELADQVVAALENCNYLRVEGYADGLHWSPRGQEGAGKNTEYRVRFVTHMAPDRLKLHLYRREGDELLLTILYRDGTVFELRPGRDVAPPDADKLWEKLAQLNVGHYKLERLSSPEGQFLLATYPAPTEDGTKFAGTVDITIEDGIEYTEGCLVGAQLASWLGPQSSQAVHLKRWIEEGEILTPEQVVSGRRCTVIAWRQTRNGFAEDKAKGWRAVPPSEAGHWLFFDTESHLLVRWDSVATSLGTPLKLYPRSRVHDKIVIEDEAPKGTWELDLPPSLKREVLFTLPPSSQRTRGCEKQSGIRKSPK
jgi:hypothetical protein